MPPGIFSKIFKRTTDRENYERRREKVEAAIEQLRNETEKAPLRKRLAEVGAIAATGDYARAYAMLNAQKADARSAAKDVKAGGTAEGTIALYISNLSKSYNPATLANYERIADELKRKAEEYFPKKDKRFTQADLDDISHRETAIRQGLYDFFAQRKSRLENDIENIKVCITQKEEISKKIDLLEKARAGADIGKLRQALALIDIPSLPAIGQTMAQTDKDCLSYIKNRVFDWINEVRAEHEVRGWAKEKLEEEQIADRKAMSKTTEAKATPYVNRKADMSKLVDAKEKKDALKRLKAAQKAGTTQLDDECEELSRKLVTVESIRKIFSKPDSDEAFDLLTATKEELLQRVAEALDLSAEEVAPFEPVIAKVAERLKKTVTAACPNKLEGALDADRPPASMRLNGGTYVIDTNAGKEGILGRGGFGVAVCYKRTDAPEGEEPERVVVKIPTDASSAEKSTSVEARAHRKAMGGKDASDSQSQNIVGMKGLVTTANGDVAMVSEYCETGGLDKLSQNVQAASDSGLISEAARQAMARRMFKQTVKGMQQVRDIGIIHQDLKEENFFVSEDGTVKVADFGSASTIDEEGQVASAPTTPGYADPDLRVDDKRDTKYDTRSLGVVLEKLAGGNLGELKAAENRSFASEAYKPKEDEKSVTALDRLRNAMLDPDPTKRPTLDAVLESAYMQEESTYTDEDVETLNKATLAYSKAVKKIKVKLNLWNISAPGTGNSMQEYNFGVDDLGFNLNICQSDLIKKEGELRKASQEIRAIPALDELRAMRTNMQRIDGELASLQTSVTALESKPSLKLMEKSGLQKLKVRHAAKLKEKQELAKDPKYKNVQLYNNLEFKIPSLKTVVERLRQNVSIIREALMGINNSKEIAPYATALKLANKPFTV